MTKLRPLALLCCVSVSLACADDALGGDGLAAETGGESDTDSSSSDSDDSTSSDSDDSTTSDTEGETDTAGESETDTDTGPDEDDCPIEQFPTYAADPANGAYPDPFTHVYCEGDEVVVEANGIPNYEFVQITPNPLAAQGHEFRFPRHPEVAAQPTEIPFLGTTGVAVNGIPLYGPNEGPFPDPFGDPVYNGIVDFCEGHTAMVGDYHYHAILVECLRAADVPGQPSPIVAYALDGFPIYGPQGCMDAACEDVVEYESGWVQTGDPTTEAWDNYAYQGENGPTTLDQCNGHVGPKGDYHYHATSGFPYLLGCYAGTAPHAMQGP